MPPKKLMIGGAAATAVLSIRVARSLYGRWRVLPGADRRRIESLAEELKAKALDLRGAPDPDRAGADLRAANATFAAALIDTAEADPEIGADEVSALREELRRELERLAGAEIRVSRASARGSAPSNWRGGDQGG